MLITRDEIASRYKRRIAVLPVPGIGDIRVQSLTEAERASYEGDWFDNNGKFVRDKYKLRKPHLLVLTMLQPEGEEPMWATGDREFVGSIGPDFVGPVFDAIEEFCGIKERDPEEKRDAEKKSGEAPASSS